jgi:hypothetical protein
MADTALTRFLFRAPEIRDSPGEVIAWWEARRLPYNVAVGACGTATVAALQLMSLVTPGSHPGPPLLLVVAYGICANVAYTSGWMAELVLRRWFGSRTSIVGAALFRYGFVFSLGLTLLPIAIGAVGTTIGLLSRLFP